MNKLDDVSTDGHWYHASLVDDVVKLITGLQDLIKLLIDTALS